MVVRRFFAANTRECLRLVREALGTEALILANRAVPGGVEIMAVAEREVTLLTGQAQPAAAPAPIVPAPVTPAPEAAHAAVPENGFQPRRDELVDEVRMLREVVEGQLSAFAWRDVANSAPGRVELLRELLSRGFGAGFARDLAGRMPAGELLPRAVKWAKSELMSSLQCVPAGEDIVTRGGVHALVGPTGVGKTTTVAKIAASCTLQHGPSQVALVTTDSYRIGAVDQLRIYGRILGVPVYAVKDEDDLMLTLAELQGRHLVLIDTVGMSQRDRRVAEQVAMLSGHGRPVSRLLLLSAVSQAEALEDVVRRYRGDGLEGCILTKVDEAPSIGGALDVILRAGLPLHYVANGQRVPEDLHLASPLYLVERAFRGEQPGGFRPSAEEMPLVLAARAAGLSAVSGA